VLLLHLPDGREADNVNAAMKTAIAGLPTELLRSVTWEQGRELAHHESFMVDTEIQVDFCDSRTLGSLGNRARTRTQCFVNTYRRALTSRCTPPTT
jgi:hypothetical protein